MNTNYEIKKIPFSVCYPIEVEVGVDPQTGDEIMTHESMDLVETTARRLKAAMAACEGIPTEALENKVVLELVCALWEIRDCFKESHQDELDNGHCGDKESECLYCQAIARANAAITQAEGK